MELEWLNIQGYRSLYDVKFVPRRLSTIVGPNNSGKTNFVEAIEFLAEAYRHGLEVAINRKGGIENISHRKMRRTRLDLRFEVGFSLTPAEVLSRGGITVKSRRQLRSAIDWLLVEHSFSFRALGEAIESDYEVASESYSISAVKGEAITKLLDVWRDGVHYKFEIASDDELYAPLVDPFNFDGFRDFLLETEVEPGALLAESFLFSPTIRAVNAMLGQARLYQLVPLEGRTPGVPTPNAEIEHHGRNLPALVAHLQRHDEAAWAQIMGLMRRIIPGLTEVKTQFTPDRRLALQFVERGVRRAWSSEDVSDGTIQSLALFTALFDKRTPIIIIEEPENSIHPWIIRNFIDACRDLKKQIILTTHSPVLISYLEPDDIYVAWRSKGETSVEPLLSRDPELEAVWRSGAISLFDLIDSGAVVEAVPAEPE